jgi:hypothetical protein
MGRMLFSVNKTDLPRPKMVAKQGRGGAAESARAKKLLQEIGNWQWSTREQNKTCTTKQ